MNTKATTVPGGDHIIWKGHAGRHIALERPCPCGCDKREGWDGVGYLTGSDDEGNGFTLLIEDEAVYRQIHRALTGKDIEVQA